MSQSTPINMLRRGQPQETQNIDENSNSQLVETILKEMGASPGIEQQSNINSQALQYTMDSSQVPPNNNINPEQTINYTEDNNYIKESKLYNDSILDTMGFNLTGDSLRDKLMKNIKYPLLVFVICFIISLPEINRIIFGFFPKLLLESGQVTIGGVLFKSLIGMILFSCISLFI